MYIYVRDSFPSETDEMYKDPALVYYIYMYIYRYVYAYTYTHRSIYVYI